jgi:hypothetical protein
MSARYSRPVGNMTKHLQNVKLHLIYTTWPKVCGHLLVKHLIPKSWALQWSWSTLCCYNLLGRLSTRCWNIAAELWFSNKSISEVGHWCWAIRTGLQSAFQFIPKVFDVVEVRALCRPVKFFHTDLDKLFLYGPCFVYGGIVMLKQERAFTKLLPQI